MKCPKCTYENGYDDLTQDRLYGDKGDFFRLPLRMEKEDSYGYINRITLFGCPKCLNVFIQ